MFLSVGTSCYLPCIEAIVFSQISVNGRIEVSHISGASTLRLRENHVYVGPTSQMVFNMRMKCFQMEVRNLPKITVGIQLLSRSGNRGASRILIVTRSLHAPPAWARKTTQVRGMRFTITTGNNFITFFILYLLLFK